MKLIQVERDISKTEEGWVTKEKQVIVSVHTSIRKALLGLLARNSGVAKMRIILWRKQ